MTKHFFRVGLQVLCGVNGQHRLAVIRDLQPYNNNDNEVFECPFSIEPKARTTNIQTKRLKVPDTENPHAAHTNVLLMSLSLHLHTHTHTCTRAHTYTHVCAYTNISQTTQSMFML